MTHVTSSQTQCFLLKNVFYKLELKTRIVNPYDNLNRYCRLAKPLDNDAEHFRGNEAIHCINSMESTFMHVIILLYTNLSMVVKPPFCLFIKDEK